MSNVPKKINKKAKLLGDINKLVGIAAAQGFLIWPGDVFALGFLCGKYDIKRLNRLHDDLCSAIAAYNVTDELGLCDTIGEVLASLLPIKI